MREKVIKAADEAHTNLAAAVHALPALCPPAQLANLSRAVELLQAAVQRLPVYDRQSTASTVWINHYCLLVVPGSHTRTTLTTHRLCKHTCIHAYMQQVYAIFMVCAEVLQQTERRVV